MKSPQPILPAELRVMPFNLQLLERIGLWGPREHVYRFILALSWATFIILIPKAFLGMGSSELDAIIKGVAEFVFEASQFVSISVFAVKRSYFERMVDCLRDIFYTVTSKQQSWDCHAVIRDQHAKIDKYTKVYTVYCLGFGLLGFNIPPTAISYYRYFSAASNDSGPIFFELPMEQEFYGLQIRTNFAHYNLFLALSITAYVVCGYFSVIKVTSMLVMINYCSLVYRLVAIRVKELSQRELKAKHDANITQVVGIVDLHEKAYEVTNLVEEIINIPIAIQFVTCVLYWCLTMFYVSTNINLRLFNVMVLLLLSLIETYGYSYLCSQLTLEADSIGKAIYELPWYDDSAELQRHYRLILQRTQCKTGLSAAKFFLVSIEKFGRMVNMSYSYYIVLKDVLAE